MIPLFNFTGNKCPLCLVVAPKIRDFVSCRVCGTMFTQFSIIMPAGLEYIDEEQMSDQEMN